jgi:membrane-associated phospholipid phosphatase
MAGLTRPEFLRELDMLDRAVYEAIAAVPTPSLDRVLARLSDAADQSKLWLTSAGVLALVGGPSGRRAAGVGLASVGVSSLVSNIGVKWLVRRRRPDRAGAIVPEERWVHMPTSRSFPSGHSASAFAFAWAVGAAMPPLSLPLHLAAATVAYSRVHTGVHYPGDTIAGALIGTTSAALVRQALTRLGRRHDGPGHDQTGAGPVGRRTGRSVGAWPVGRPRLSPCARPRRPRTRRWPDRALRRPWTRHPSGPSTGGSPAGR